jgi:DNA-binding NtrC family response regulator
MILIIDDDYSVTASLSLLLKQAGLASTTAAGPEEALERLTSPEVRLVLQDMNFSRKTTGEEGLELLAAIRRRRPELPVILITAWGSIELAVQGVKAGAADFITKPWSNEQILHSVRTALSLAGQRVSPRPESVVDREALEERWDLSGIVGDDPGLLRALELAGKVAETDASVLITGDSGTGKEVVAEFIHRNGPRRDGPFIQVNLGGIPSSLFESEMFGHVRGAFTDAVRDRDGRFTVAQGGTILLDEIGELEPSGQVKMLRVLQDRRYEVLGTSRTRELDVRVISATNRDLEAAVAEGSFREDLFYRLNLVTLRLPSLAERPGDVPLLARHFGGLAARTFGKPVPDFADSALGWLTARDWPGNVRQLKHLIERAVLVHEGEALEADDFERILEIERGERRADTLPAVGSMTIEELEKAMIEKGLAHHAGNLSRVAESLGLSRAALYRRLEKYGLRT